ncbi:MAG: DUF58 domain-containing protein [Candidatus Helarchaeota archaeon]
MFTRHGRTVLMIGIICLLLGLGFYIYFLTILGSILIFSAVIGYPFYYYSLNLKDVQIIREIDKTKSFVDDYIMVKLTVKNNGNKSIDFLEVEDKIPPLAFKIVLGENKISTRLDGKSEIKFSYVLYLRMRGEFKIGPTRIRIKDRLGYLVEEQEIPEYTPLLVYPTFEDVRRMEAFASRRRQGLIFGAHRTKQKGMGTEFFGLREYIEGDEFRRIDWKATARSRKPMIREFETEKNIRVIIFLDASKTMTSGSVYNNKLEYSIRAALLLSKLALERHDQVGLVVYSDKVKFFIEPRGGPNQFWRILEVLARVKAEGSKKIYNAADFTIKRVKKDSFIFILSDMEDISRYFVSAVLLLKSYKHEVIVISPFGPWFEVNVFADLDPIDMALLEAISEEAWGKRVKIQEKIKRLETDVLNVSPQDYFPLIITEYLKCKKRGGSGIV